jgi:hypothetical protein
LNPNAGESGDDIDPDRREPAPIQKALGEALRRAYAETLDERLPDPMRDLLDRLK